MILRLSNILVIPSPRFAAGFFYGLRSGELIFNNMVDFLVWRPIFNNMVELSVPHLDTVFHALGDATRRTMLRDLSRGERTVSQLAEPFDISLAAASKHIKALENAGLIRREVRGRTHVCRLAPERLAEAHEWLDFYRQFWNSRLDILEQMLREDDQGKSPADGGNDNG